MRLENADLPASSNTRSGPAVPQLVGAGARPRLSPGHQYILRETSAGSHGTLHEKRPELVGAPAQSSQSRAGSRPSSLALSNVTSPAYRVLPTDAVVDL